MGYPVTDVIRDAAGSLDYAAMVLEAPEHSRMRAAARDLAEAESIILEMLAALEDAHDQLSAWADYADGEISDEDNAALKKIWAAIAKAKGSEA